MSKTLLVILGPTGVGKTKLSLSLAEYFNTHIISADSRQLYADIPIGTDAPSAKDLKRVKHHFVGTLKIDDYYSATRFEEEALEILNQLFTTHQTVLMTGGSMMYIDALCKGIDYMPTITLEIRNKVVESYKQNGLEYLVDKLELLDPDYSRIVDKKNPKRIMHALEICLMTGKTYSSYRTQSIKTRPFRIIKIGLIRPREEIYERINNRVDKMIENGLIEEAKRVYQYKENNSLNTLGYKELFCYFEKKITKQGEVWSLDYAIDKIKRNTRIYSRKQITWFKRDKEIRWFHPDNLNDIIEYLNSINC
ncbi:MAG TPA: tRNA (adenosine(37)-N6)-dimethylallyltransferase MiaA [Bacteroidaceae bacterium]|nr:tRNA (adenosine(37)-N6)-dimethylallyltransferase MiaA [Bacteroidaceae bacterium]